jgi:glycosyltransferase involved in cell wall biosynthesis
VANRLAAGRAVDPADLLTGKRKTLMDVVRDVMSNGIFRGAGGAVMEAPRERRLEKMRGQNIICFAKDWDEDPTSNNHVMRLLAQDNRVLWLNSISMRAPNLGSGRDLRKIGRKLAAFFRGPRQVAEGLWVYTPIVVPLPHNRLAIAANHLILKAMLRHLRQKLAMPEFQLWTFLPNAVEYVGQLGESMVVYYCIDEWSKFKYLDGLKMAAQEETLCRKADIVFATAKSLEERRKPFNPETHLASHGVDYELFSRALSEDTPVAPEIAALPKPVIGFFGLIHEWVDLDLIAHIASRHPNWSIVMIGKKSVDVSALSKYKNVHFLGRKPYADLPSYCKGFAAGLIPFAVNELTYNVNPIKLREYLSAGVPVVSTALPEVAYYRDTCVVASDYDEFEKGLTKVIAEDTTDIRRRRSDAMRPETWEQRVTELGAQVMRVLSQKKSPRKSARRQGAQA